MFVKVNNPKEHKYAIYRGATATIHKSKESKDRFAPYIASFSSRGPSVVTLNILQVIIILFIFALLIILLLDVRINGNIIYFPYILY
jgi:hypothetical protein